MLRLVFIKHNSLHTGVKPYHMMFVGNHLQPNCQQTLNRLISPNFKYTRHIIVHTYYNLDMKSIFSTRIFYRGVPGFSQGLALRLLVPWISHSPPICWSTLWKSSSKLQLICRFDMRENTVLIIFISISKFITRLHSDTVTRAPYN